MPMTKLIDPAVLQREFEELVPTLKGKASADVMGDMLVIAMLHLSRRAASALAEVHERLERLERQP